ncbi:MAG: transcription termination/antitermination factor NusG [Candidatus Thermochlorobacter aerophilum]|jgi:transcriptional antiterminator NusG|uniref:Transcription termination/antitermination protein NusG n=1 Tax=Candidatus Thermochlorobacter aerophilus TaxID=1868324 RepID=A0A395M0N7_9BACT|nr:MAG: transcription termination/antitermination factor NusG [Candidatus Thermochlorobacter aerophilum]
MNAHEQEQHQEPEVISQEQASQTSVETTKESVATVKRHPDVKWYAVRTYSGHERKVKEHIDREVEKQGIKEKLPTVHIPYEKFVEVKDGKKKSRTKNAFPGYILIETVLDKQTKSIILDTPSVIGFLGVKDEPTPLRPDEIKRILEDGQEEKRMSIKAPFEVGSTVKITDGPFSSLTGTVQEINPEKMKVKVLIGFFGRSTPTELDFSQVKPISA